MRNLRMLRPFVIGVVALAFPLSSWQNASASDNYIFTVYVEEGSPTGHVFMSLNDGKTVIYRGFHTIYKNSLKQGLGLIGCGGGQVRPENDTPWNVRRVYHIDAQQLRIAKEVQKSWGGGGSQTWSPSHNCGDYVGSYMTNMGLLPKHWSTLVTTPGGVEKYLLAHGGERNPHPGWSASETDSREKAVEAAAPATRAGGTPATPSGLVPTIEGTWQVSCNHPGGGRTSIVRESDGYHITVNGLTAPGTYQGGPTSISYTLNATFEQIKGSSDNPPPDTAAREAVGRYNVTNTYTLSPDGQSLTQTMNTYQMQWYENTGELASLTNIPNYLQCTGSRL
jgi:hypothetical protein